MQITNELINTIGLIFDIIGVLILFKYGLPSEINKDGNIGLALENSDKSQIDKWHKYNCWSKIGLISILIGFMFQLLSNYV